MKFALFDVDLGISRELPLLAEGGQLWGEQVALDHGLSFPRVRAVEHLADLEPGEVVCYMQDRLDVDGAAAYHDEDKYGRIFIRCSLSATPARELLRDRGNRGESLLGLLMHELGETMVDPTADIWRQQPFRDPRTGRIHTLVAQEICDPVQEIADSLRLADGTDVDRIAWVKPAWFDSRRCQSVAVDSHGALAEPLTLAPGGYQIVAGVSGERDVFAELIEHHELGLSPWRRALKKRASSRTLRRLKAFGAAVLT